MTAVSASWITVRRLRVLAAPDVERLLIQSSAFQYLSVSRTNAGVDYARLF